MLHRTLSTVCRAGIAVAGLSILAVLANSALSEDAPSPPAPTAPTAPTTPSQPPLGQTVEGFIKQTPFLAKVYNDDPAHFLVQTNYKEYGERDVTIRESAAGWKNSDGTDARYVLFYTPVTQWYKKDTDIPPELTRAIAEANDQNLWIKFALAIDSDSKDWAVFCKADPFLQGMDYALFEDYLEFVSSGVSAKQAPFTKFVTDQ